MVIFMPQPSKAIESRIKSAAILESKSKVQDIESIIILVNQYCDNGQIYGTGLKGLCNSLVTKLDGAIEARDRGQPHTACNKLYAFTNEVAAKKDKQIKPQSADNLIQMGNAACQTLTSDVGDITLEMVIQFNTPPTYQILYYGGTSTETLHFSPTIIYVSKPVNTSSSSNLDSSLKIYYGGSVTETLHSTPTFSFR